MSCAQPLAQMMTANTAQGWKWGRGSCRCDANGPAPWALRCVMSIVLWLHIAQRCFLIRKFSYLVKVEGLYHRRCVFASGQEVVNLTRVTLQSGYIQRHKSQVNCGNKHAKFYCHHELHCSILLSLVPGVAF